MKSIVIASPQIDKWGAFVAELGNQCQMVVTEARSGAEALVIAREKTPVAAVIDQSLGDMSGIEFVLELVQTNALINVAVVSDQSDADFHEATEGLGILMKLPPIPNGQAAVDFCRRLTGVI